MPYHRALFFIHSKCNICIYTLNSQSIPLFLPPSLSATMSLISMSVSLFLFPRQIQYCHILDSMYRRYHMVFLFLTYFTQYDNLQLHPCCCKWHYFIPFMAEQYFIVYTYHIFLIYSSVDDLYPYFGYSEQCCYEHTDEGESSVAQSCPTLCDPMDCKLSGSSVHGIFQARVLEWVAIAFSRGSSQPRDRTRVSLIAGRHFVTDGQN